MYIDKYPHKIFRWQIEATCAWYAGHSPVALDSGLRLCNLDLRLAHLGLLANENQEGPNHCDVLHTEARFSQR